MRCCVQSSTIGSCRSSFQSCSCMVGPSEDRPVSFVFPSWAKVRATLSNTNKPLLGFQNLYTRHQGIRSKTWGNGIERPPVGHLQHTPGDHASLCSVAPCGTCFFIVISANSLVQTLHATHTKCNNNMRASEVVHHYCHQI